MLTFERENSLKEPAISKPCRIVKELIEEALRAME
jgi:hypothetical protein